jgi:hypothetical protein
MKRLITAACLMIAMVPFAFAQDKAKDAEKKAPVATSKSAKPETPKGAQIASEKAKSSTMEAEMSAKGEQMKKEPSAKAKAREAKKNCEKQAREQKLKGDARKAFVNECTAK